MTLDKRILELEAAWNSFVQANPAALAWERALQHVDAPGEDASRLVPVTFVVSCNHTRVGDQLLLLGDADALGGWREAAAVPLVTDPATFPHWSATVLLRAGDLVEYKYAVLRAAPTPADAAGAGGAPAGFQWEAHMGNRGFKTPRRAHVVHDALVETELPAESWKTPLFLKMHRIDSSELFLDPEYAMVS